MPATCVPWNETLGSNGSRSFFFDFFSKNERATITFGDVYAVLPFGKPSG
jgi:hypothetical protein